MFMYIKSWLRRYLLKWQKGHAEGWREKSEVRLKEGGGGGGGRGGGAEWEIVLAVVGYISNEQSISVKLD